MSEASKYLALAEAGAREQVKAAKNGTSKYKDTAPKQFPAGMEWDVLQADSIVLLGLTNALQESYMGFAKCLFVLTCPCSHSLLRGLIATSIPHTL
jgi:hypothetical protein